MIKGYVLDNEAESKSGKKSICRDCAYCNNADCVEDGKLIETPSENCWMIESVRLDVNGVEYKCGGFVPDELAATGVKVEKVREQYGSKQYFCPFTKEVCSGYCEFYGDDCECLIKSLAERIIYGGDNG